jgi:adenine-specific DNA-methyltransferase
LSNEFPSQFADRLGIDYGISVSQNHKKLNGQFFTPLEIASAMASYAVFEGNSVSILDPGCGTAVLSCALIEYLIKSNKDLISIKLVVYETDPELVPVLKKVLEYLEDWVKNKGIQVNIILHQEDYILQNADYFNEPGDLFTKPAELFDIVISNPPYFKLAIDDPKVLAAKVVVNGHPNIYAIFMALSAKMLNTGGELIFITPRSYAAGNYFKKFRAYFFNLIDPDRIHLFVSRKDTFRKDKVLQETVIFKGTRRMRNGEKVIVSSSAGIKDLANPSVKAFPKKVIIDAQSTEKILYLPTTDFEEAVLGIVRNWTGNLSKYQIQISTGPVVAFRSLKYICEQFENSSVQLAPLIWLHNVKQMKLEWPVDKSNKGQYINIEEKSKPLLIPKKNYVLLRRFSSKDDKSRLIAAPCFGNDFNGDYIGIENKVNYIYRPKGNLERNEVLGLCALYNSRFYDIYFRIFNGNVNVSATELREMALPSLEMIREIGERIIQSGDYDVINANLYVDEYFQPTVVYE